MTFFRRAAAVLLAAVLLTGVMTGGGVSQSLAPAMVQRTTLIVADIDKSVAFYERLGLVKVADQAHTGAEVFGATDLPLTADPGRSRLVIMSSGDARIGTLGLLWYDRPPLASARGNLMGLGTGDMILSFQVADLQTAYGRLDSIGARIHRPPTRFTSGNSSDLKMYVYDPDGHMVEISQIGGSVNR